MKKKSVAASVFIYDAESMTQKGANEIARWLEKQAKMLRSKRERAALAKSFRARYYYSAGKKS